jgi:hypothetical protein
MPLLRTFSPCQKQKGSNAQLAQLFSRLDRTIRPTRFRADDR